MTWKFSLLFLSVWNTMPTPRTTSPTAFSYPNRSPASHCICLHPYRSTTCKFDTKLNNATQFPKTQRTGCLVAYLWWYPRAYILPTPVKGHFVMHIQCFYLPVSDPPRSDGFDIPSAAIIDNFGQ